MKQLLAFFIIFATTLLNINSAHSEKRVALVIGNSEYTDATPLTNPLNDANDMSAALERLGFDVVKGIDLDFAGMRQTLKDFAAKLEGADTALFYYAGHAVQVNGENYIAPIDTVLEREADLPFETFTLNRIQSLMEENAKTLLMFLDACRDNPLSRRFVRSSRSVGTTRGLARPPSTSEGTYIAFSTQPGNVALDGDGRNSPFTKALLDNIEKPGIEIASLMTDVRRQVYDDTNKQQLPWTNSALLGHFYFNNQQEGIDADLDTSRDSDDSLKQFKIEETDWKTISKTNDPEKIKSFLKKYPDGNFAYIAGITLERLERAPTATETQQNNQNTQVFDEASQAKVKEFLRQEKAEQVEQSKTEIEVASLPQDNEEVKAEYVIVPNANGIAQIQTELNRVGCEAGAVDGKWGNRSRRALTNFGKHAKIEIASTDPDLSILDDIKKHQNRVCPLVCGPRYNNSGNQCVLKTCPSGQKLSTKGACYVPKKSTKTASATKRKSSNKPATKKPASSSNCFVFNGKRVCE